MKKLLMSAMARQGFCTTDNLFANLATAAKNNASDCYEFLVQKADNRCDSGMQIRYPWY